MKGITWFKRHADETAITKPGGVSRRLLDYRPETTPVRKFIVGSMHLPVSKTHNKPLDFEMLTKFLANLEK